MDSEQLPRCDKLDGSSLSVVPAYTEAGQFCEVQVVTLTDGTRTAKYVPLGDVASKQPTPQPNDSRPVWEIVVEDMQTRDRVGRERYGVPLQAGNGRDSLRDAYEEALDLCVYLRQAIAERA